MSAIPHEIRALAADMKRQATLISTQIRAIRARVPEADVAGVLVEMAGLHADLNRLQSLVAAADMVGVMQPRPAVKAEELELHPGHAAHDEHQRELMLASLHRCGDHTLDPDPEPDEVAVEDDRNVAVEVKGGAR